MLSGKNVLITGGGRGNGDGIASGMIDNHAKVVVFDKIKGSRRGVEYIDIDLSDSESLESCFCEETDKVGGFDVLINNAGVSFGNPSEEYKKEQWDQTLKINLTVPFLLSQMFAKSCIKYNKDGCIINITSLGAEFGFPENPAYCASKGGLKQLSKALAYDWAKYGIRVNNVGPGYMHTSMTEKSFNDPVMHEDRQRHMMMDRWGEPGDLAGVCVFLSSDMSSYITGQDIYVDGGWTAKGL